MNLRPPGWWSAGAALASVWNEGSFLEEFADNTFALRKELTEEQTALGGEFSFTFGVPSSMDAPTFVRPMYLL